MGFQLGWQHVYTGYGRSNKMPDRDHHAGDLSGVVFRVVSGVCWTIRVLSRNRGPSSGRASRANTGHICTSVSNRNYILHRLVNIIR